MVTVNCKCCKQPFEARQADVNRGWGKFCSKSCKAVKQVSTHGRNPKPKKRTASKYKRHDGRSPMKHKFCWCGANAINGVYSITGIEWMCDEHWDDTHPFDGDNF